MTLRDLNRENKIQKRQIAKLNCTVQKLELIVTCLIPRLSDIECSALKKAELEKVIDVFIDELINPKTKV